VQQYEAIEGRAYRFDFAVPGAALLIECQGGIFRENGAHNTGPAILRDCEKAALALIAGWRVMHVAGPQVKSGQAIEWIKAAISGGPKGTT
jgi:very-short-patch-repair endonuclease